MSSPAPFVVDRYLKADARVPAGLVLDVLEALGEGQVTNVSLFARAAR